MAESVIRGRKKGFTMIYNSVLKDQRLSLKTIGVFAIMQSFPDDWEYSISGLANRCRCGRDTMRKCLKELEDAGYLLKEQSHKADGKFACNTYTLQDEAQPYTEKPYTVTPSTDLPSTENRPQDKTIDKKDYTINGNNYVKLRDVGEAVGFNVYWDREKSCVQIESDKPYTGTAPAKSEPAETAPQPAPQTDTDAMKLEIVERTNAIRTEKGAAALVVNDKLMQAAQVRADEMAVTGVYSHTRPDGRKSSTVTDCKYVGENIHCIEDWALTDRNLAEVAVWSWSSSAGHLKNMTNSRYGSIGIGLSRGTDENGDPCWYCVQLFMDTGCSIGWIDTPVTTK